MTPHDAVRSAYERVAAVREELARAAIDDQRVWSVDGMTFHFDTVTDTPVPVGGYVVVELPDGRRLLGQVTSLAPSDRPGPSLTLDDVGLGPGIAAQVQVPIHSVVGAGTMLGVLEAGGLVPPERHGFDAAALAPASPRDVARAVAAADPSGALRFGTVLDGEVELELSATGVAKHTFVCGQSGSGKTYSIGKLLEQLLLRTTLSIVVLDPNSDYVTLTEPRALEDTDLSAEAYEEQCAHLRRLAPEMPVFGGSHHRLAVLFGRLRRPEQALVLGLDPVIDSDLYGVLGRAADAAGPDATIDHFLHVAASVEGGPPLAARARNLGIDRWDIWANQGEPTIGERLGGSWRAAVMDLGSVGSVQERSVLAAAALGRLWEERYQRQPRLILIDEAHNVCPAAPTSAAQDAASGVVRSIAAEGRKFGLYLLLATQEPHKVHPDVLSQCSNLVLMRTTGRAALDTLASTFSDLPPDLLDLAPTFGRGQGIASGPLAPHPVIFRTGRRLTRDGGQNVPTTWITGADD